MDSKKLRKDLVKYNKMKDIISIISEGIKENIPNCMGVTFDKDLKYYSYDHIREKYRSIHIYIHLKNRVKVWLNISSSFNKLEYRYMSPNILNECVGIPFTEISHHMESKRESLDKHFVLLNSLGIPIDEHKSEMLMERKRKERRKNNETLIKERLDIEQTIRGIPI